MTKDLYCLSRSEHTFFIVCIVRWLVEIKVRLHVLKYYINYTKCLIKRYWFLALHGFSIQCQKDSWPSLWCKSTIPICVVSGSHDTRTHSNQTCSTRYWLLISCNGLRCMRYPIVKLPDGCIRWRYINVAFNKSSKNEIVWVRSGERDGQGRKLLCSSAPHQIQHWERTRRKSPQMGNKNGKVVRLW